MNRAGLNVANINAAPLDVVQRVVLAMTAVAVGIAHARVFARDVFQASGRATVSAAAHLVLRASIAATALARSAVYGQDRVRGRVWPQARAQVSVVATVFEREYITSPVAGQAQAYILANVTEVLRRSPLAAQAVASAAITGRLYYTRHHVVISAQALAQAVIDFETRKQISYDEDAPIERVARVPEESRLVMVA